MDKTDKEKNFISAVIYCCDDAATIGNFISMLCRTLGENFLKYEIVIVDDASRDGSENAVRASVKALEDAGTPPPTASLLSMSFRQGLEASMNAGLNLAIGDFVFEFDSVAADFDASVLMDVYRRALSGYDIVSAGREGATRWSSRLFYKVFNRYANLQYEVGAETFRILSRRAINRIQSVTRTIPFRKAAYANCGLAMTRERYVPVAKPLRKRYADRHSVAADSLILFTDVAFRGTVTLACLMLVLSLAYGLYALFYKLAGNPVEGWTTTIMFLASGFCGLFFILAVVIKYLQTLVNISFRKKGFLFKSVEKIQ